MELEETAGYVVPACSSCGGVLKPDVVFFGENVPARRVARCYDAVDALPAVDGVLLCVGTSLTVMSGFRFVRRAARAGTPVVIVNRGVPGATSWRRTRSRPAVRSSWPTSPAELAGRS